jgi:Tol biopolymer transport system component
MAGTGHPSFSPDGSRIVVDHVLAREGHGSINLVHVDEDRAEHLAQLRVTNHTHTGTHLHPVWSRDGRQVLYASDASGHAQLCVIRV